MNTTPVLEWLDPATLTVDTNVRKDAGLTKEFVASIKEHGVLEPVIAHRKDDGTVHVLMGQRRTRGAVEAARPLIPVMITDSPDDAERIVTQVVENIQRAELTEADEADAYHQLSLIGVSAAAIAKKTGRTKTTVDGALKAKASQAGDTALGKGWSIDDALIMAEFEGNEDALAELESVIMDEPDQLLHVAQLLRDRRESAAALATLIAELEAQGKTVVADAGHYADEENLYVSAAKRADGEPATDDDANAYVVSTDYRGQHNPTPAITGWKELGFTPKYERYDGGSNAQKGPMTDEQKAERKTLIANNKAMVSATTVRREFVKNLLAKKQAPKGWQYFTVHAITHHSETASGYEGTVAAEMVGAKSEESGRWGWNPLRDHVGKSTARPEFSLIALVCAGYEKTIAKDSWRSSSQPHRDYLNQLVTWGYTPSEVENLILDSGKPAEEETAA
ncbi:ParB/RepB/Spo0J family partition protein [Pseudarthrobacter sp. AL07]|uniref:ParB/RepB/Spo0J family partition protein n=1 Tax=unclassified Pseudarthrobacter TaxID=2647000 RepID=UPI00249CBCDC|nr:MULTISPECIES: ParB/RepB/Spo0J family partition protein [unclassified Pseudarthrobacter]MDI3195544.1 ParB/RepB/Spo0J family partition protein [Pseudarthrobacter sp. AL20]MDI3209618.1 ParB/RepB/Spo0J family partition protein [Pseudarthrobacter sp. AL07]